ncbi:MAG: hypothetical protein R2911_26455 [Caldilineaceae bacterium]
MTIAQAQQIKFWVQQRNGDELTIVGKSKAQLSKNDINRFLRRQVDMTASMSDCFVLVTYMISEPDVEEYAQSQNVALYYSCDF